MKIQILINDNSWALNYKKDLKKSLSKYSNKIIILSNHKKLNSGSMLILYLVILE